MDDTDRSSRRRRGLAGGVAAVALLAAGVGALAAVVPDREVGMVGGPAPTSDLSLTCTTNNSTHAIIDSIRGRRSLTMLLGGSDSRYVVDIPGRRVLYLRHDGTVHTVQHWFRHAREWYDEGYDACSDAEETRDPDVERGSAPLTLTVGHCWIDPVEFGGATWDVIADDQFGWGGGVPRDFAGSGQAWRAGDVVSYRDESGTLLTLVPAGGRWTVRHRFCR